MLWAMLSVGALSDTNDTGTVQAELDWIGLQKGPNEIGFSVKHVYDSSRSFGSLDKRPIQISIWYPAERNSDSPIVIFEQYLNLRSSLIDFSAIGKEHFTTKPIIKKHGISGTTLMKARLNADPPSGTFPVILFAPGNNGHPNQYLLMLEYLASHGFVIVSSPSMGHNEERGSWKSGATREARLFDAEFLLNYLKHLPYADASRIGLLSHSAGGGTMITLAGKRLYPVKVIISLDGIDGGLLDRSQLANDEYPSEGALKDIVYRICIAGKKGSTITTWPTLEVLSLFEEQNAETVIFNQLGHEDFTSLMIDNASAAKWRDFLRLCRFVNRLFMDQLQ
jgi:hypothetical protein